MRKILYIVLIITLLFSCKKDEIRTYNIEDSAVNFSSGLNSFSMKGMQEDTRLLKIPVFITGCFADYDREISLSFKDSLARQGVDYELVEAKIDSGAIRGDIVLRVKKLSPEVKTLSTRIEILPNRYFREGFVSKKTTKVVWSEAYTRPSDFVWRYWHLFFSKYYSENLHKILISEFGVDVERYTMNAGYARQNPELIFKSITWWYGANRQLQEAVRNYDLAHPDAKLMHSADVQYYRAYTIPFGDGTRQEPVPTIAETLNSL